MYDLSGGTQPLELTFDGHNTVPFWSVNGRIAFARRGMTGLTAGQTDAVEIAADAHSEGHDPATVAGVLHLRRAFL